MRQTNQTTQDGIPADSVILTTQGWRSLSDTPIGTPLAHPTGMPSQLLAVRPLGERDLVRLRLADGTSFTCTPNQIIRARLGEGSRAPEHPLSATLIHDALLRGRPVRLPRTGPLEYGLEQHLPLDAHLLGLLLGDGYLRPHSVTLCNEQPEVQALAAAGLPAGARLGAVKVGQAGTGSVEILGVEPRMNPVLNALQNLNLAGKRAWEKHIPAMYLQAPLTERLALFQGLMDTDGCIDRRGRIEFSSSSELLCQQVLELIHGLGGRSSYRLKTNVWFTSPRQSTPKQARDAHRLLNIRVPDEVLPFRRSSKVAHVVPGRLARQWKITEVVREPAAAAVVVVVSAPDTRFIIMGPAAIQGMPMATVSHRTAA